MKTKIFVLALTVFSFIWTGCGKKEGPAGQSNVLRIGFFPNITHAQGLIGYNETQTKNAEGFFEKATGAKIEWYPFNAGPSAIEALSAGSIDATYVGPNPVLNGYIRSKGKSVRVLAGAARGGVALVIQPGSGLKTASDFRGKRIATPQLGNTQDVSARAWLKAGGLEIRQNGGDAFVIPTQNPDQLDLFKRKELDAVWTVEPWVSRLELEANAEILLSENDTFITLLATSTKALSEKEALLKKFVVAHNELTERISKDVSFAKPAITAALKKATGKEIGSKLFDQAWPKLKFTTEIHREDFETAMNNAFSVGLIPEKGDLANLFVKP